jgi:hypothetical protein
MPLPINFICNSFSFHIFLILQLFMWVITYAYPIYMVLIKLPSLLKGTPGEAMHFSVHIHWSYISFDNFRVQTAHIIAYVGVLSIHLYDFFLFLIIWESQFCSIASILSVSQFVFFPLFCLHVCLFKVAATAKGERKRLRLRLQVWRCQQIFSSRSVMFFLWWWRNSDPDLRPLRQISDILFMMVTKQWPRS